MRNIIIKDLTPDVRMSAGEAIQEAKISDDIGPGFPKPAYAVLILLKERIGKENPQSAALAGYMHALSVSPYQKDGASLIGGAALAAQMGDPLLAHHLNRDPVVNEVQGGSVFPVSFNLFTATVLRCVDGKLKPVFTTVGRSQ